MPSTSTSNKQPLVSDSDWLVMLDSDCRVTGVDGGPPRTWIGRYAHECLDMPQRVQDAAQEMMRQRDDRIGASPVHRKRLLAWEGEPAFTLIAVEAIPLSYTEVALEPLVQNVLAPLKTQAERAGVELVLETEGLPDRMWLDAGKVGWALATLAGSALRHVTACFSEEDPQGRVSVRADSIAAQRRVRFEVTDNGRGMPEQVRAWLIEPDPSTGRATGLALRLVYDVVRAHGGHMLVTTATGTRVTLWLPTRA
jgi:two-component system, sensor histidine kinase and response regulator